MRASTIWIAMTLACAQAAALPQRHDQAVAVPATKEVTVDGDLSEWDLTGAIEAAFDEALRPKFTVRLAFEYDTKALYIGAHFTDDTPLLNRHDPQVEPTRGWDGDCLQVRLCSDPAAPYPLQSSNSDRICHLAIWFYTDQQLPVLQMQYGMDYHGTKLWTGTDAGVAFRKDADGKGYTLEARIPWERLNASANPPKADDQLALVAQPLWSDGTGWKQVMTFNDVIREAGFSFQGTGMWGQLVLSPRGNLPPTQRPRTVQEALEPLDLTLPVPDTKARSLSAAVYDASGQLVRTLPVSELDPKARHRKITLRWDGLDDDGRPLPAGSYSAKVLTHRGVGQKWVASLHNSGNPPWRTDDGTGSWGGDHGQPIAAASDDNRVYLGWTISEAGWAIVAIDKSFTKDGKVRKLWGQHQVLDIGILITAMATDGERLFVAQDGKGWGESEGGKNKAGVVLWEAKSGKPINFPFGKRALVASEWPDSLKSQELQTYERLSVYHPLVEHKRFWDRIREHDVGPQTLGLNLLGIAVSGDVMYASLYLENKVVAFNWRTGEKVRDFAVPSPVGLAATKDGTLLAVSGKSIVRIDPKSGQVDPVVSEGLSWPWAVALDADKRLYVTDCGDAMQVRLFDAQGKPAGTIGRPGGRPWVGAYDPKGMLLPAGINVDPEGKVWVMEYDSTPKRVSVWSRDGKLIADLLGGGAYAVEGLADEQEPRWINVHDTLFHLNYRTGQAKTVSTLIRPQMRGFQFTPDGGYMGRALRFHHTHGETYLAHAGRGGVVIYLLGTDMVGQPVAALGPGGALPLHGFTKDDIPSAVREDFWRNSHAYAFWWRDLNADGLVQPDEMAIEKVSPFWGLYWGAWVDEDLTIWSAGGGAVWRVPVKQWLGKQPVYPKPSEQKPLFKTLGPEIHSVLPGRDSVYVLEQKAGDTYGKGAQWQGVSRYTLDGKRLWAYRRTWLGFGLEAPLSKPGDVVGAMKFIGKVALDRRTELIGVNGYFGQFNVLSSDGLWVASLCKDNRYGPKADETTVWPENFSGQLFRNRDNGRIYLIAGDTDARVWEVTGLDGVRTAEASFGLTQADSEKALAASMRKQGVSTEQAPIALCPAKAVTVDGNLSDWDMSKAAAIDAGADRSAKVALAYDDKQLLVAFDVRDDSPMKNTGKDAALLFKTGDACDVLLAADPGADPKRTRPAKGDTRVLFSVLDDKPVCVLYQPVLSVGERQPRQFSSPTGSEAFDRVVVLPDAKVAIQRTGKGYTLEAAVPLSALGFAPKAGMVARGDVGVIFSDPGGSRNVLRAYYANKDTAIVNDIPSEARLEPAKWGAMRIE